FGQNRPDPAEPLVMINRLALFRLQEVLVGVRPRVFGNDDDGKQATGSLTLAHDLADLRQPEGHFGNQHDIPAPGNRAAGRDPAAVTAHHLDDHHAVVRFRRRMQPVNRVNHDGDRRIHPDGVISPAQIVINRFRYADDGVPFLRGHPLRRAHRPFAADHDQRIQPVLLPGLANLLQLFGRRERVNPRRPDDRAAAGQDAADRLASQEFEVVFDQPLPAVFDAHDGDAVEPGPAHDGADDGVDARTIAAAGKNSNLPDLTVHRDSELPDSARTDAG